MVEALIEARVKVRKAAVAMGKTGKRTHKELSVPVLSALEGLNTFLETNRPTATDRKVTPAMYEVEKIARGLSPTSDSLR